MFGSGVKEVGGGVSHDLTMKLLGDVRLAVEDGFEGTNNVVKLLASAYVR